MYPARSPSTRSRGPSCAARALIHRCERDAARVRQRHEVVVVDRGARRGGRRPPRTPSRPARTAAAPGRRGGCRGRTACRRPPRVAASRASRPDIRPPALEPRLEPQHAAEHALVHQPAHGQEVAVPAPVLEHGQQQRPARRASLDQRRGPRRRSRPAACRRRPAAPPSARPGHRRRASGSAWRPRPGRASPEPTSSSERSNSRVPGMVAERLRAPLRVRGDDGGQPEALVAAISGAWKTRPASPYPTRPTRSGDRTEPMCHLRLVDDPGRRDDARARLLALKRIRVRGPR